MKMEVPEAIRKAMDQGVEYFMGEDCEWKLEIEEDPGFIEGSGALIFANNGYGDYLFLKKKSGGGFEGEAFVYYHEGPLVEPLGVDLETLLGLEKNPPSKDDYPAARYETGEPVLIGDHVQFKSWVQFWRGWRDGVVHYVPGISGRRPEHERDGLKWVEILGEGVRIGPLVDPETGIVRKIRFIGRAGSGPKQG